MTTAFTRRPAASRLGVVAARAPPSASHTNVSRLPAGPGSAGGREAEHRGAQLARAGGHRADGVAPRSGSRTTPPRPTRSRPASNCGLTIASAVEALGAAHASTAGSTLRSEMKETSIDDQVGRVGQLRRLERAGVDALDHGHARVLAQRPVELAVGDVERDHVLGAAPGAGSR